MAKGTLFENNLFDSSSEEDNFVEIDDEGNLIENETEESEEDNVDDLGDDEIEVDDKGNIVERDADGNIIESSSDDDEEDDESSESDEEETGEDNSSSSEANSDVLLSPLAKVLKEEGVLPDLELEEGEELTAESLVEGIRNQIKQNELSDLNEDARNLVNILRNGGDVSQYLQTYQEERNAGEKFKEITEDNAEEFTRTLFKMQGLSDKKIDDIIDDRIVNGTLLEKAKADQPELNELIEKAKTAEAKKAEQAAKVREKELQEQAEKYRSFIDSTEGFIKGNKLDKSVKDKIFKLGTEAIKTEDGQQVSALQKAYADDPIGTEAKLNYLYIVTDGFKKMDNLTYSKTAKSESLKELQKAIEQDKRKKGPRGSTSRTNNNDNKPSIVNARF